MNNDNPRVLDIKRNSIIADIALDFLPEIEIPGMWEILERYHHAGFHFLNIALAGDLTSIEIAVRYISRQQNKIRNLSDKFIIVKKAEDIKKILGKNFLRVVSKVWK